MKLNTRFRLRLFQALHQRLHRRVLGLDNVEPPSEDALFQEQNLVDVQRPETAGRVQVRKKETSLASPLNATAFSVELNFIKLDQTRLDQTPLNSIKKEKRKKDENVASSRAGSEVPPFDYNGFIATLNFIEITTEAPTTVTTDSTNRSCKYSA